jgi:hypothetical protein
MSPSEATNRATGEEWRALGFYYETREEPPSWLFIGSRDGLSRLASLLGDYVADPRNATVSEHEHYGPYMYLEVQTAEVPEIDQRGIRGSLHDLARLRDLIAAALRTHRPGQSFVIGREYAETVDFPLCFQVRGEGFDPASADPQLRCGAEVGDRVTLRMVPPWIDRLPQESREVFEFCVGRTFTVREIDDNGLLVLDVAEDVDARFGGSMNDIRVEPQYVEATTDGDSCADA